MHMRCLPPLFCRLFSICLVVFSWSAGSATAYESDVVYNLRKSRDALLSQRQELLNASARISQQILQLQQQNDRINAYLRDTDAALRDVEISLRTAK
ncbi:MAG TPA: hypothetical protein V6D17_02825 [Candidatus Obscuribacterales bacterium]